ncbi:MAG: hypothetical protein GYB31_00145 [Bacteroidetes bacterium]|nr:hypothetical protein [Bacteroidota bacterium]
MKNHRQISDSEFIRSFESCELPPEVFSHEAHLRLAWLYLYEGGLHTASVRYQKNLQEYVTHWGAADKYHETLTIAAVKTVWHFMQKSETKDFFSFMEENPRLNTHFKALLEAHYSNEKIWSKEARAAFVDPDLLPYN